MRKLLYLFVITIFGGTGVIAQEDLLESKELKFIHYDIGGSSIDEILNQLNNNSLINSWALTRGNLDWTNDCKVSIRVEVIMPRFVHPETLSETDRREVERMLVAITQHEMRHVYLSKYYAEEFKRDGCPKDRSALIEYWGSKSRELDENTDFGRKDGVHLFGR